MRLVSVRTNGAEVPGAVLTASDGTDRLLLLGDRAAGWDRPLAALLADPDALDTARARVADADPGTLPPLDVRRLAPPVRPATILCLGYGYRGHLEGEPDDVPVHPNVFVKTPNVLTGPGDPVVIPPACTQVDYEGEIAVVIGRRASRVTEEEAMAHVAGFTLFNDVSDRDWQSRTNQWALGKCVDGFGPLGPWVVTTDEVPDLRGRAIEVERDGVVTVRSSTDAMVFDVAALVAYLSQVVTLEPGDVMSTGTPARSPEAQAAHTPIRPGDSVTVRVAGLGSLTTTFAPPEDL